MKRVLLAVLVCGYSILSSAQGGTYLAPAGGGPRITQPGDELTPAQRAQITTMLWQNAADLVQQNLLPSASGYRTTRMAFAWPVKQAAGFDDIGYYGVSNYVDHNTSINSVQDYQCGTRSYDLSSGYNHRGTDIFTWPFGWQKMNQNAVEVVAAAEGVVIGKADGNGDNTCSLSETARDWNAVYIQHPDGTVTWYGHLKKGSLTTKAIGQSVTTGEYLGVVGSSGNSTSPHLHFEVYKDNTCSALIDPWDGACNPTSEGNSWWVNQEAYRVPTISKVLTHSVAPTVSQCQDGERLNPNRNFAPGNIIYLSSYFRDNINSTLAIHRIFRPDGSVWSSWTQAFTTEHDASWWYYTVTLPTSGTYYGIWRYEVTYNGKTASTAFGIGMTLPVDMVNFTAVEKHGKTELDWTTANEEGVRGFDVERGVDGSRFERIGSVAARNASSTSSYSFKDIAPKPGKNIYRLRISDNTSAERFSKTVSVQIGEAKVSASPVPFTNSLTIRLPVTNASQAITYQLLNAAGVAVAKGNAVISVENTSQYPPGVYLLVVHDGVKLISQQKLLKL